MELAQKIASNIRKKERFSVYVVIPMWPEGVPTSATVQEILYWKVSYSQKFMRFMIYVHAKGIIVDDVYVILGSANINQRSLAGSKDTEIAMGSYQPHHTWASKNQHAYRQVYGYRMSLWAEHLGALKKCYMEPESLECVNSVNKIGEDNWKRYTDEKYTTLEGHILRYPLQVDGDGKVTSLPRFENFPDVGGKIMGSHSPALPDILTT